MELDDVFKALSDPLRRRLLDELMERDGQTLFELQVRMIHWHGTSLSRQGLSRHLGVLEAAGLLRTEWQWRSKHHFINPGPIGLVWRNWLHRYVPDAEQKGERQNENRCDEHHG